jgi:hypothetical protein
MSRITPTRPPRRHAWPLIGAWILIGASRGLACPVPGTEVAGARDAYRTADAVTQLVFRPRVHTVGVTKALQFRDAGYRFASEEEINRYNVTSAHVIADSARVIRLKDMPLESPVWSALNSEDEASEFLAELTEVLPAGAARRSSVRASSPCEALRKAIAQRDLLQTYAVVLRAEKKLRRQSHQQLARRLRASLAGLLHPLLLEADELQMLQSLRPTSLPDAFTTTLRFSLEDHYLPRQVLVADPSWMEIPSGGMPFRHFRDYGGRSFIKVYMRMQETSVDEVLAIWRRLFDAHGDRLHRTAIADPVPVGLETLLVRTFGVILADGSYHDSHWPEEVIIRAFKYPASTIDLATSDFRGTLFYQYKMSRRALLRDPASLGLRRVFDDDEQFFGFFGDVPDPRNSYSSSLTTMRSNCISCHSELFYGLNTIFSFERDPGLDPGRLPSENSMLRRRKDGQLELHTPEYSSLLSLLGIRSQVAEDS